MLRSVDGVLANRAGIVTGGAGGLGSAICRALAAEGAHVIVNYRRSQARAQTLVDKIRSSGGRATALQGDVTDPAGVAELVRGAQGAVGGPVTILINNAWDWERPAEDASTCSTYEQQLRYGVMAPFMLGTALRTDMRAEGWGRIISIGSEAVARPLRGDAPYVTAKMALIGLTRAWAVELGPDNITVNVVSPGFIPVERNQPGHAKRRTYVEGVAVARLGTPADVAGAVLYLASPEAAFVSGQCLTVNGGKTFAY